MDIVLYEPEISGNVGAVARVMKNFDFRSLVLINPKCKIDEDAKRRAKHAQDVLKKAKIVDENKLKKYDLLIATTAKLGGDYNIPRIPLSPAMLAEKLKGKKGKIGLLFGPEGEGLSNDVVREADFVVNIPAGKYGTLNLSHAVTVILYELFQANVEAEAKVGKLASVKDKEKFFSLLDLTLDGMDFTTEEKKETQRLVWRRMVGKAMLTRRELFALFGFLKKLK